MRSSFLIATFALVATACGRPASEIVHAPITQDPIDLTRNPTGNLDGNASCGAGEILLRRGGNLPSVCVFKPSSRHMSSAPLTSFWNNSATKRCGDIATFVNSYRATYMQQFNVAVEQCQAVSTNSKALFVKVSFEGDGRNHTQAFEIAESQSESATVLICTSERTNFIENKHCTERFKPSQVPASIAAIVPEPISSLLDFYPTLLSLLSN